MRHTEPLGPTHFLHPVMQQDHCTHQVLKKWEKLDHHPSVNHFQQGIEQRASCANVGRQPLQSKLRWFAFHLRTVYHPAAYHGSEVSPERSFLFIQMKKRNFLLLPELPEKFEQSLRKQIGLQYCIFERFACSFQRMHTLSFLSYYHWTLF